MINLRSVLELGETCQLDVERGILVKRGLHTSFSRSQTLALQCFVQNLGHPVSKQRLAQYVWGESNTSERLLYQCIHRIRKNLEDDVHNPAYLVAIKGMDTKWS
ncbi:winged helix-turn-helix domain-containing protein [Alicyclobacillus fastidiosus]|uniref:winged helix-turn-helix domain-containing protein n=1 Tax=Alicyclobacillus fastidiosus TaxID=392011 RepID=UPI0034DCD962